LGVSGVSAYPVAAVADRRDNVLGHLRTSWTTSPPWSRVSPMGCCLANGQPKTMLGEPLPTHCSRCLRRWAFPCDGQAKGSCQTKPVPRGASVAGDEPPTSAAPQRHKPFATRSRSHCRDRCSTSSRTSSRRRTLQPSLIACKVQAADLAISTGLPLSRQELSWIVGIADTSRIPPTRIRIGRTSLKKWTLLAPTSDNLIQVAQTH
jgi:hypothetical protein